MTDIKHHLTDALLMGYSAGALPEAFNLVVATHISVCDECRARLAEFDTVGGAVLDSVETEALNDDALALALARIAGELPEDLQPVVASTGVFPRPLQDYVGGDVEAVNWRYIGGGVRQAILETSKDATVRLLHIPAGTAVPDHGHKGTEITMVLQGAYRDDDGVYARGDIEVADEALVHTPIAEPGEDCICIAATDARLKFNALLPKIAQPFLRI